jgi:hypothetical protein
VELISELLGVLERQTKILDDMSNGIVENKSLVDKNIIKSDNSTFIKSPSSKLIGKEKSKVNDIASLFVDKFIKSTRKGSRGDTATKIPKLFTNPIARPENARLSSNDKIRYTEISKILVTTFFDEKRKRTKDTKEKTLISKVSKPLNKVSNDYGLKSGKGQPIGDNVGVMEGLLGSTVLSRMGSIFKTVISKLSKLKLPKLDIPKLLSPISKTFNKIKSGTRSIFSKIKNTVGGSKIVNQIKDVTSKVVKKVPDFVKPITKGLSKIPGAEIIKKTATTWGNRLIQGTTTVIKGAKQVKAISTKLGKQAVKNIVTKASTGVILKAGGMTKMMGKLVKVPVIGPIITGMLTKKDIDAYKKQYTKGEITKDELQRRSGTRVISGITGAIGASSGAILAGTLGSVIPGAGTALGAIAGGILGDMAGTFLGDIISKHVIPKKYVKTIGAFVTQTEPPKDEMQDFIIKNNKIYKFSNKDEVMGIKSGGAINDFLKNGNSESLKSLVSANNLSNQLLASIVNNTSLMIKALGGQNKGGNVSIVATAPATAPPPKSLQIVKNNRMGYAASPYSL